MMRLLITLDFPPENGGIQRYLCGIVQNEYIHEDSVLVGAPRNSMQTSMGKASVRYITFPVLSRLNKKFSLLALLVPCLRLAIIHRKRLVVECGNVYAALVPWLVSFFVQCPYKVFAHGTEILPLKRKGLKAFILCNVLKKADLLFANSRFCAGLLKQTGIDTAVTIKNPRIVLPDRSLRTMKPCLGKSLHILAVGRLVEHKGHDILIQAIGKIAETVDVKLTLAGKGPFRPMLEKEILSLNLSETVAILDNLSDADLAQLYAQSDVFVLPSLQIHNGTEGFGIVLLEAMAHGVPIVASATGGIVEVLNDGDCGLLVKPGQSEELADAILKIKNDAKLRNRIIEKADKRVRKLYAW